MNTEIEELAKKKRELAKNWGWAIYGGGVVIGWAFTQAFFTKALTGHLLLQIIVAIGITLVSANAFVLANALHYYTVNGWHRGVAIGLYSVDMLIMIFNIIVSASEMTGNSIPWVKSYEPYAYATVIVPVATWGALWILDPWHAADVKKQAAKDKFILKVIEKAERYIDTPEGQEIVQKYADAMANQSIMDSKPLNITVDTGKPETGDTGKAKPDTGSMEAALQEIFERAGMNGHSQELAKEVLETVNPQTASIRRD